MSYLSQSLRLHFAGQFQATVSTVNNEVTHFNNEAYQTPQAIEAIQERPGGSWNPQGDGVWRLMGCQITSAFLASGKEAKNDPALNMQIADSDDSAPAKIVDLDPQQQMVSTLFGLIIRIADENGSTLMKGAFQPAAFTELWSKIDSPQSGDRTFGAMWQSVVTVSEWKDVSHSAFLSELKAEADANGGLLSIKFNVDLYSMNSPQPGDAGDNKFARGRIVGTIGPAKADEPARFVLGRQLSPEVDTANFCVATLDVARKQARLDLGNALRVDAHGDVLAVGDLHLSVVGPNESTILLGTVPQAVYTAPGWYATTAGIIEFALAEAALSLAASCAWEVVAEDGASSTGLLKERADGLHVRADLFVFRLSEGESATATFYATKFGQPYAAQDISFFANPSQLGGDTPPPRTSPGTLNSKGEPYIAAPSDGVRYASSLTPDAAGRVQLTITGGDTQKFRRYIDGQIYGIGYGLAGAPQQSNPWDFISVLVFDVFTPGDPVTWQDLHPIFQQYANLYPVMARFVDLGSYEQVTQYARMLIHAFSLPEDDANTMPVTRDLSPAKRAAILQWLKNPLLGPLAAPPADLAAKPAPADARSAPHPLALLGGKTAAMARRHCVRNA